MTLKEQMIQACNIEPPLNEAELAKALPQASKEEIAQALMELQKEGGLVRTRKDRFVTPTSMGLVAGRVQGNARGFAFCIPVLEGVEDVFIGQDDMGGAVHGDIVLVRVRTQRSGRTNAQVEQVVARAHGSIVGTMNTAERGIAYVVPDDRRISTTFAVPGKQSAGAQDGDKVVVQITTWGEEGKPPQGQVVTILGSKGDRNADILATLHTYNLSSEFPQNVVDTLKDVPQTLSEADMLGREDLRKQACVTIDGADSKDFDDAVYAEMIGKNYRLYVHIADVSHYVRGGTALDDEAFTRGTSAYFPDRVIPMLPEELSNGICSLNPGEDRLVLSCIMDIDGITGKVTDHRIAKCAIRSSARLVYEQVSALLDGDKEAAAALASQAGTLRTMRTLQDLLFAGRAGRGSIDFDIPEATITVDEVGKPIDVSVKPRGIANRMIEEFMLLANEVVAAHSVALQLPFLYRVHEAPDPDRIRDFATFCANIGYPIKIGKRGVTPMDLAQLLKRVAGQPEEGMLSRLMLRSLQRARYATSNLGHFGLALVDYCHFTSPIRRYPDLFIHRVLTMQLAGKLDRVAYDAFVAMASEASVHASARERNAMEAERDVDDLKKAEYMLEHVGEQFKGVISGVISSGFFVELPNTVEGMVRVDAIKDDHYLYEDTAYRLIGRRSKRIFRLGDEVDVMCTGVDMTMRRVEFGLPSVETKK